MTGKPQFHSMNLSRASSSSSRKRARSPPWPSLLPHEEERLRRVPLTDDAKEFLFLLRAAAYILTPSGTTGLYGGLDSILRDIVVALGTHPTDTLMQRLFEPTVLTCHADLLRPMSQEGKAWLLRLFDSTSVLPSQCELLIEAITIAVLYDPDHEYTKSFEDHARAMMSIRATRSPHAIRSLCSPSPISPSRSRWTPETSPTIQDSIGSVDCIPTTPPYDTEALKPGTLVVITQAVEAVNQGRTGVIVDEDDYYNPTNKYFLLSCTDPNDEEVLLLIQRIHVEPCCKN